MQIRYYREYSKHLDRMMEYKTYGHDGQVVLVIPTQDNRFYEWEDQGMFEEVKDLIEQGRVQFVCADGIDFQTWSNVYDEPSLRMIQHEKWMHYLVDELIPSALEEMHSKEDKVYVTGASLGALHATNLLFRFPDVCKGVVALSGIYDVSMFLHGYQDEITYLNNPLQYLPQMSKDHTYIQKYNEARLIFCVGQGQWEDQTKEDLHKLEQILKEKGIHAWCDYWGLDVYHDWPWWRIQIRYFLEQLV